MLLKRNTTTLGHVKTSRSIIPPTHNPGIQTHCRYADADRVDGIRTERDSSEGGVPAGAHRAAGKGSDDASQGDCVRQTFSGESVSVSVGVRESV